MADMSFFREIGQTRVSELNGAIFNPTFIYDACVVIASFMAPLDDIVAALPSHRLQPLRVTPAHGVVTVAAFEQRESDLGAHRAIAVGVPILLDEVAPVLRGLLRQTAAGPTAFITRLLVDTPEAQLFYGDLCGLPATLATISLQRSSAERRWRVTIEPDFVLELEHVVPAAQPATRWRIHTLGRHGNHLLRSEMIMNVRQLGRMISRNDACLELGNHAAADELRRLRLGRLLDLRYMPAQQAILSTPLESFAIA